MTALHTSEFFRKLDSCKGKIFDFDGTIADSMNVWYRVDMQFLSRRNLTPPDDYGKKLSMLGFDRAAAFVIDCFSLDDSPEDIMDEWNELALEHYSSGVFFKPHAREYIEMQRERDNKISVATTLSPPLLQAALENNKALDLFDALVCGCEVEKDKREPDIYLLAAKRMGLVPQQCVVFEDILPGIQSAKRGGMLAVGVRDDSGHQEIEALKESADCFIDSFKDLLYLS